MRKKLQIFNCILKPKLACKNAQFPSVEPNHSSKTQPISIPVAVFRTYICQVPNETSTDEQTERDRRDNERAGVRSSRGAADNRLDRSWPIWMSWTAPQNVSARPTFLQNLLSQRQPAGVAGSKNCSITRRR